MIIRKGIKEFLTANGESAKADIVADCVANGARERRVERILERMTTRGKLVQNGDNYVLAP